MLYDPEPVQRPENLCIRKSQGSMSHKRVRTRPSRIFTSYIQDQERTDQPLCLYFLRFGKIIPAIEEYQANPPLITVSHVCYSILDKIAGVEIEWVNALSQHLEFDNVQGSLKIFKFPSFCMLMYRDLTSISKQVQTFPQQCSLS
jgi:hypothetical protein